MTGSWTEDDSRQFIDYGEVFVPRRAEQIRTIVAAVDPLPDEPHILDLGCGQGHLTRALLERYPNARIRALDGSPRMLQAVAAATPHSSRVHPELFNLEDRSWRLDRKQPVHAAVTSLALHHLGGPEKRVFFHDMYELLAPGGCLAIADVVRPASETGRRIAASAWTAAVEEAVTHQANAAEILRVFHEGGWNMYDHLDEDPVDRPSTLAEQLDWLREAGFAAVDVYWMSAGHAVFGGRKRRGTPPRVPSGH